MSSSNRSHPDLVEIIAEFDRTTPLDASTVRRWMTTDDIEAAGALMALLANSKHDSRINPPLRPEEWDDPAVPKSAMNDLKTSLERTYSAAPDAVRRNIINSALEQLFRNSEILNYFSDWKQDALLESAYNEARESNLARKAFREKGEASE